MKNIYIVVLTSLILSPEAFSSTPSQELNCDVIETPKGIKRNQKRWNFKAPLFNPKTKKTIQLKSRHIKSLVIESYSSWGWEQDSKGNRRKALTAHIEIGDENSKAKVTSFADGGSFENANEINLSTIYTTSNNDSIAIICSNFQ